MRAPIRLRSTFSAIAGLKAWLGQLYRLRFDRLGMTAKLY
jgi:hypothetical protein